MMMDFSTMLLLLLVYSSWLPQIGNEMLDSDLEYTRRTLLRWLAQNQGKIDQDDMSDLMDGPDYHINRYLDLVDDEEKPMKTKEIVDVMAHNLAWRKSIHLSALRPDHFPCEFWLAGVFQLTNGRETGEPVICWDPRAMGSYSGGLRAAWYAFTEFQMNHIDQRALAAGTHWKVLVDLNGVSIFNLADIRGLVTSFGSVPNHYINGIDGIYLMAPPGAIESMARMLLNLAPKARVVTQVLSEHERFFVVKKRDLPDHFGGRLTPSKGLMMVQFPGLQKTCVPLRRMARRRNWTDQSVNEFLRNTRHLIEHNAKQLNFNKSLS